MEDKPAPIVAPPVEIIKIEEVKVEVPVEVIKYIERDPPPIALKSEPPKPKPL